MFLLKFLISFKEVSNKFSNHLDYMQEKPKIPEEKIDFERENTVT